jgi:hypothetical protein
VGLRAHPSAHTNLPLTDRHNSSSRRAQPGGAGCHRSGRGQDASILATPNATVPRGLLRCRGSAGRDAPCLDVDAAIGAYRFEHPAVVGDQQQCARVGIERRFELLDGGQVEVIGGVVEDQQVDTASLEQGEC